MLQYYVNFPNNFNLDLFSKKNYSFLGKILRLIKVINKKYLHENNII